MNQSTLSAITTDFLEADFSDVSQREEILENYLREVGNSEEQLSFWMGFCLELSGEGEVSLKTIVDTEVALAVMQKNIVA